METQYLNALRFVLDNGTTKTDRTGVGTISCFGMQQRYEDNNSIRWNRIYRSKSYR